MSELSIDRRGFLTAAGGLAAVLGVSRADALAAPADRKWVLRVAHLTDIHVQPELHAPEGLAACLHHIQELDDRPNLILSGGDHVMDAVRQSRDRTNAQWEIWKRLIRSDNAIPVRSCIGNHDIRGWEKGKPVFA